MSETGLFGGGLNSPQAPGFSMLYYDTNHLAVVDPDDPNNNESEVVNVLRTSFGEYYEIDENKHSRYSCENKRMMEISQDLGDNHQHQDADLCSPFCICQCCHLNVTYFKFAEIKFEFNLCVLLRLYQILNRHLNKIKNKFSVKFNFFLYGFIIKL